MMKVKRNKTVNKLIDDLNQYHEDASVKIIQQTLRNLHQGQELTEDQVDEIFKPKEGDWAEPDPGKKDSKHGVKKICTTIKGEMFEKIKK